jgi:hypothetical protein
MRDEPVVELLTEIRDLQRTHLERYEEALRNQSESIAAQKQAIEFQRSMTRRLVRIFIPLVVTFLLLAGATMLGILL